MIGNEINETIGDIFNSLLHRYEINLEKSIQGSKFVFDYVDTSFYKSHKISLNRARSYLDPSEWIKNKTDYEKFDSFKFEFVNGGRVLSAKDNNGSKNWKLYIQSSKGVTADAWKYAIKCA